jgi:Family of unknown function (DUF6152)
MLASRLLAAAPSLALLFALVAATMPAFAHHGWGSYDADKPMTVEAVIEAVEIGNPHAMVTINHDGRKWDVVLAPPSRMQARGATANVVAKGKPVKVYGYPRRDGTTEMRAEWIEIDGRRFELR